MDKVDTTLKITDHGFWIPRSGRGGPLQDGKASSVVSLRNPLQKYDRNNKARNPTLEAPEMQETRLKVAKFIMLHKR